MLFIALLAAAAAATPSLLVEPVARPAAAVVDRFHHALKTGDGKGALALMAGDALIFESGHVEQNRAEYQAVHLDGDIEYSRGVTDVITARSGHASGNFAWIASNGRTSGSFNGTPVDRATTETMVLRRSGGKWRIVHIHWSSAAP
ncbi:MAG: nuclear transport factor 2 family protein [Sphingomicrobium sp.]